MLEHRLYKTKFNLYELDIHCQSLLSTRLNISFGQKKGKEIDTENRFRRYATVHKEYCFFWGFFWSHYFQSLLYIYFSAVVFIYIDIYLGIHRVFSMSGILFLNIFACSYHAQIPTKFAPGASLIKLKLCKGQSNIYAFLMQSPTTLSDQSRKKNQGQYSLMSESIFFAVLLCKRCRDDFVRITIFFSII